MATATSLGSTVERMASAHAAASTSSATATSGRDLASGSMANPSSSVPHVVSNVTEDVAAMSAAAADRGARSNEGSAPKETDTTKWMLIAAAVTCGLVAVAFALFSGDLILPAAEVGDLGIAGTSAIAIGAFVAGCVALAVAYCRPTKKNEDEKPLREGADSSANKAHAEEQDGRGADGSSAAVVTPGDDATGFNGDSKGSDLKGESTARTTRTAASASLSSSAAPGASASGAAVALGVGVTAVAGAV